ncbi:MAG: glycoside hydrolase family 3 C-terminal domain-containing protein [Bacilli bacterium]|nr:glycoside hydrolase family 3 C-terminal domain-containing protein [Bacilli bacterium]
MKRKHILFLAIQGFVAAAVIGATIYGNIFAASYDGALDSYFGRIGYIAPLGNYKAEHESMDAVLEDYATNFNYQVAKEGSILLKNNDNGLPIARNSKISLFGSSCAFWMEREKIATGKDSIFINGMREAFEVNNELRKLYLTSAHTNWGIGDNKGDGSKAGTWTIDEVPQSEYTDAVKASYSEYNDAAIVVFSRSSGEGADLPRNMDRFGGSADEHYLELNKDERDLLQAIQDAGCFKKTVVILHTNNPMQMDFLNDYDIDAVVQVGGTGSGEAAIKGIIELLVGEANFSGRTVDTYCFDNLSAPAMQNFGDFRYVDSNGNLNGYAYVNLAEGIYVGYKYYETRYTDVSLGASNAGTFDYDTTVAYPFGYGLSYTEFSYGELSGSYNSSTDKLSFNIEVTNSGEVAGKEVVELYVQVPYTDYDRTYGVEKSAVSLVGYGKTESLESGKKEKLSFEVDRERLASFDAKNKGTYILEKGDYKFTAAKNAHEAANNFLNGENVYTHTLSENDFTTYATSDNNTQVTTLFNSSSLEDSTYLSRSNWAAMDGDGLTYATGTKDGVSETTNAAKTVQTSAISSNHKEKITANGWESSGNPKAKTDYPEVKNEVENGVEWKNLLGKKFDDPLWEDLLDRASFDEEYAIYKNAANGTAAMPSINKPQTFGADGPEGVSHRVGGAEMMIACTYNKKLMTRYGELNGDYALLKGTSAWYSPGMNIHRTPFSGRNYEYVSEDTFLTGDFACKVINACHEKGLINVLKHCAMNGQETNRQANNMVATYAEEQAMRETYFRPFQMAVEDGNCYGIMAAMNRIGDIPARANYALNVSVIREEWGFKGFIITDYNNIGEEDSEACLSGGITVQFAGMGNPLAETESNGVRYLIRENTHYVLYSLLHSNAAAGIAEGQTSSEGVKVYVLLLIALDAVVAILALGGVTLSFFRFRAKDKEGTDVAVVKRFNVATIIYLGVLAAVLIAAVIIFFTWALPLLQYAFNIV